MTLVTTRELMNNAVEHHYGQGAFNVLHLETAEGLIAGAELAGLPLILQISQNCVEFHGGLRPIAEATLALAEAAEVELALHLDHAEDIGLAKAAVDLGFGSIMYDAARLPFAQNVATTAEIVGYAHAAGVYVEAELGEVGGKDGAHAPGVRTDPGEAAQFVADTGVDALAVAVGSSHAMQERSASLDVDLIARLAEAVPVPLVLHGSSGVADEVLVEGIRAGMVKVNVSTHLNGFFTRAVREYLDANPTTVDSRKYLGAGRAALVPEVARLLTLFRTGEQSLQSRTVKEGAEDDAK